MRYLFSWLFTIIASLAFSQNTKQEEVRKELPQVQKSKIEFNGGSYNGYFIELNASPDIVEEEVKKRFKSMGAKPKETKGFMVYRNIVISRIDPVNPVDAFIKVEKKSKKEKEQSMVSFIVTPIGQIPEEKLKADAVANATEVARAENGDTFLLGLIPAIEMGVFEKDFSNQQTLVKKEEKTLANLKDDQSDLERKFKKVQDDIEYNKKAQERQTLEVDKVKNKLSEMLSKKPSSVVQ